MQDETNLQTEIPHEKRQFIIFNFNTLLALIVLAGLAVLYILHFTGTQNPGGKGSFASQSDATRPVSIVYLNLDSLNTQYEFVKVLRRDLETTGNRLQAEVMAEQGSLEKEAADFQRQISANAITEEKAKVIYERLMQRQQALVEKKDRYTQMVAEQELNMNVRLLDTVTNFLKRYNSKFNYDYIMGYKKGGEILLPNETLDITKDALNAINAEYKSRNK